MNKKLTTAILIVFLALSFSQQLSCRASETESPAHAERVLKFLSDVVDINLSKYEIYLSIFSVQNLSEISIIGDTGYLETSGIYELFYYDYENHENSFLRCSFTFADATLRACKVYATSGSPLYNNNPSPNAADAADIFMERFEKFTGDSNIATMRSMLVGVDSAKDSSKIVDDLKLEVSSHGNTTLFYWKPTYEGVDYPGINLSFKNGHYNSFVDSRSLNSIGDTTVNVTEEQAVALALKRAETFSYRMDDDEVITNFSIVHDYIRAEPFSKSRGEDKSLYPIWRIYLPLSELYPGFVNEILVELWADSGEVISCVPLSIGGPIPDSSESPSTVDPTLSKDQTVAEFNQFPAAYVAAILAAVLVSVAVIAVVLKKRISK
ncbi:MAG: hypothetical protein ACQCN6_10415 [Candidatus Bathyarchaeia archaeon]|jgi:hypothetical protein